MIDPNAEIASCRRRGLSRRRSLSWRAGCSQGSRRRPSSGAGGEKPRDFIQLDPGTRAARLHQDRGGAGARAATAIALPGACRFDEDHTQRVASPIDGARRRDPGQARATRCTAGSRWSSCRRPRRPAAGRRAEGDVGPHGVAEKAVERVHKLQAEGAVADKDVAQVEGDLQEGQARTTRARRRSSSRWASRRRTRR